MSNTANIALRDEFNEVIIGEFLRRLLGQVPDMAEIAKHGDFVLHGDGTEWFSWSGNFQCRICSLQEWNKARKKKTGREVEAA